MCRGRGCVAGNGCCRRACVASVSRPRFDFRCDQRVARAIEELCHTQMAIGEERPVTPLPRAGIEHEPCAEVESITGRNQSRPAAARIANSPGARDRWDRCKSECEDRQSLVENPTQY